MRFLGLDWILGKKGCQALEQAVHGMVESRALGGVKDSKCGTEGHHLIVDLAVLGLQLDLMIFRSLPI